MSRPTRRATLALPLLALPARAQSFPDRPLSLLHGFAPGGAADLVARLVAQPLGAQLGKPVVVEGRPGAGGNIGSLALNRANPDGHIIGLPTGSHIVNAAFGRIREYDPVDGFSWLTILVRFGFVLVVRADSPWRDLRSLLAAAGREPGALQFGSGGVGSSHHLTGELLNATAGVQMTHIPYRGDAGGLTAVLSGELPLMIATTVGALGMLAGESRLRPLAVTTPVRSARLPHVPTVAEAALPGFSSTTWQALAAPPGTPPAVVARLHAATLAALAEPALRQRLSEMVDGELVLNSPAEARAFAAADLVKWRRLIEERKISAE